MGMVDSAATVLLLSAALLAALSLVSVGLVGASVLTIRVRRFRESRALRMQAQLHLPHE
jgi:hypothetical protein